MRRLSTTRDIDAPASVVWRLLTDLEQWPNWGPSVRRAVLNGKRFEEGATGTVTTVVGATLPFEITEVVDGTRWSWKVAGIPATRHTVEPLGADRCRAGFDVPWAAAPYLAVCKVALRRIESSALDEVTQLEVSR